MTDITLAEWQDRLRASLSSKTPLRIRGGGTKDFYGETPLGVVFETGAYSGIVDYEPTELVITARAGTPLAEVEQAMAAHRQMLAFEPPHFAPGATLGGTVATGLSGPRRPYAGAVRDVVLGVRMFDGRGDDLRFGGRVMKNVAGFDVARLMCGALGTLGVLTEVSIKCLPLPRSEVTRTFELPVDESIRRVNEWGGQPLPVSATCHVGGRLWVRLSGASPAVEAAGSRIGGEVATDDAAFWRSIRDHTHAFFRNGAGADPAVWRLSVKSTAPHADLGGEQLVEWGGALRWLCAGERTDPARLRAWSREQGGHATLFRAGDKSIGVFDPLPGPLLAIHKRLKAEFDPHTILNPGRLYAAF